MCDCHRLGNDHSEWGYVVQRKEEKAECRENQVRVHNCGTIGPCHTIEGVLSLTPVVDLSSTGRPLDSKVESAGDSENIATAATVVNNQVNQGRIAA